MMWIIINKLNDKIMDKIASEIFKRLFNKLNGLFMLAAYVVISYLLIILSMYISAVIISGNHAIGFSIATEMLNFNLLSACGLISEVWYNYNLLSLIPFGTIFDYTEKFIYTVQSGGYALFDDAILDAFDNIFLSVGFVNLLIFVLIDSLRTTYTGFFVYVIAFLVGDKILGFITTEPLNRTAHIVGFFKFWCFKIGSFIGRFSVALSTMFMSFAIVSMLTVILGYFLDFLIYFFNDANLTIFNRIAPIILHVFLLLATIFFSRIIFNAKMAKMSPPPIPEVATRVFWRKYQKSYTRQLSTWIGAFLFYSAGTNARIIIFVIWLVIVGYIDKQIVFNE